MITLGSLDFIAETLVVRLPKLDVIPRVTAYPFLLDDRIVLEINLAADTNEFILRYVLNLIYSTLRPEKEVRVR